MDLNSLCVGNHKRAFGLFGDKFGVIPPPKDANAQKAKIQSLHHNEYAHLTQRHKPVRPTTGTGANKKLKLGTARNAADAAAMLMRGTTTLDEDKNEEDVDGATAAINAAAFASSKALVLRHKRKLEEMPRPEWHAPWKLMRVIAGHTGWVRCIAVDVSNEWFATGSADRTIKIWDLASGTLKLTLTGHISTVRGLAIAPDSPYLYSVSEDKKVKCWDLEVNKVVRHYHGHLSGVYSVALHPTLPLLFTGGRDAAIRVWDVRTRDQIFCLEGHKSTVWDIKAATVDPQVVSACADGTVRLWDLAAKKVSSVLTHHKKGVRSLALSRTEFSFCSGSIDNIKKWKLPQGQFLQNFEGHKTIINTMSVNDDGVMFSGGDDGTMRMWDYKTGYPFQTTRAINQPGSLQAEASILASTFDQSGSRLLTCEGDKTIKFYKEDTDATPETHPVEWDAVEELKKRRGRK